MALIKCKECGQKISSKAKKCPHCGVPLIEKEKTNINLRIILIAIPIIVIVGVMFFLYFKNDTKDNLNRNDNNTESVFKDITTQKGFNNIKKNENYSVVVIVTNDCAWCDNFMTVLKETSRENKIRLFTINANYDFFNKIDLGINSEGIGFPTTIIYKNGKVVDTLEGSQSKEDFIKFLEKSGVL